MADRIIGGLFHEYSDDIYKFLAYFTRNNDVEDLLQETFLRAMKGLRRYRGDNPKSWLVSIARNVAIDHMRKKKRERRAVEASIASVKAIVPSPETQVEFADFRARLLSTLNSDFMRPGYREVIICRAIMDMSAEDTARTLGWNVGRVNLTLHRALKVVRKVFQSEIGGMINDVAGGER